MIRARQDQPAVGSNLLSVEHAAHLHAVVEVGIGHAELALGEGLPVIRKACAYGGFMERHEGSDIDTDAAQIFGSHVEIGGNILLGDVPENLRTVLDHREVALPWQCR